MHFYINFIALFIKIMKSLNSHLGIVFKLIYLYLAAITNVPKFKILNITMIIRLKS